MLIKQRMRGRKTIMLLNYYIIINVITFLLFTFDNFRHERTGKSFGPDALYLGLTVAGGALGTQLYYIIFFPRFNPKIQTNQYYKAIKTEKRSYLFWRIITIVSLIIHTIVLVKAYDLDNVMVLSKAINTVLIFARKYCIYYFLLINLITAIVFCIDKINACQGRRRVRETTLFKLAFAGGALSILLLMYLIHHKNRHRAFVFGIPAIILLHIVLAYLLYLG